MLTPVHLRDLLVEPGAHPRGQAHLSAASGLVRSGAWLHVVADDEHHLGSFGYCGNGAASRVQLHRLIPGDLPYDKGERKKRKPDLEALALLPAATGWPHGCLLALGSGSRPNRQRAFMLPLDAMGMSIGPAVAIDLAPLYRSLRLDFADLNIEGAFVAGGRFCLLQRGNKGNATSACIEYSLAPFQAWLAAARGAPPAPLRTLVYSLGDAKGVPLGFTDAAALPGGGWLFSAVAEDTDDSYGDGACVASAIGWIDENGSLGGIEPIEGALKVEGIVLDEGGGLLMVTDSDAPAIPSQLLAVQPAWSKAV